jgi:hypothetical protein
LACSETAPHLHLLQLLLLFLMLLLLMMMMPMLMLMMMLMLMLVLRAWELLQSSCWGRLGSAPIHRRPMRELRGEAFCCDGDSIRSEKRIESGAGAAGRRTGGGEARRRRRRRTAGSGKQKGEGELGAPWLWRNTEHSARFDLCDRDDADVARFPAFPYPR